MSVEATKKKTEDVGTSTDESEFEAVEKSSNILVRQNKYGQVKTNRNQKRPKPPLPPLKKTPKVPLRRSQRNKGKKEDEVSLILQIVNIFFINIYITINAY